MELERRRHRLQSVDLRDALRARSLQQARPSNTPQEPSQFFLHTWNLISHHWTLAKDKLVLHLLAFLP